VGEGLGLVRPLPGLTRVPDDYRTLAADYDWLWDDDTLARGGAINRPATARVLARARRPGSVLDAACGTGVNAAALARRGFRVHATDGSHAMVHAAAARFQREQLGIPVAQCLWADLPVSLGERFDVVLCIGNSLVHAAGADAMVQALDGLREVTRPGGHVVIDSRNWEKLHADRQIVQVADRSVTRDGVRCVSLYAWEIPDRLEDEHIAHITFVLDHSGRLETHEYPVGFYPFTLATLRERLALAGLREVDTDFDPADPRYALVATPA
jgi:SAM-dependent methyltransferase